MSRTRSADHPFVHIPPPPARPARLHPDRPAAAAALLEALREASLAGMAALGFAWGLAELAFLLLNR